MLVIVLIGLSISLIILLAFFVLAFHDVAFAGPLSVVEASQMWQPPLARDDELATWAASTAKTVTARRLAGPPTADTLTRLATDIFEGSTFAIAQSPSAVAQTEPSCPSCRHRMIGVTVPEALAIVDEIRKTLPSREVKRIHDRATENVETTADMNCQQYEEAQVVCPLLAGDDSCSVFGARPIRCRGWCRFSGEAGDRCLLGECEEGPLDLHALTVVRGTENGLSRGLESAGLDGNVYELNSVLSATLDTPVAAKRWAEGEDVFEGCRLYDEAY